MTAGTYMNLRPRVMDPQRRDDITEALKAAAGATQVGETMAAYMVNWYPDGLRERTLGAHSRKNVGVTRYYPTLSPKVVVDFEPAPPDKWYFEEKIRFFAERGMVYIGLALQDRLTEAEFSQRYRDARVRLDRATADLGEDAALAAGTQHTGSETSVEGLLMDPEFDALLNQVARARVDAVKDRIGRKLAGGARRNKVRTLKDELIDTYRRKLRGGVGIDRCRGELAEEVSGSSDGQVHPSVAR